MKKKFLINNIPDRRKLHYCRCLILFAITIDTYETNTVKYWKPFDQMTKVSQQLRELIQIYRLIVDVNTINNNNN